MSNRYRPFLSVPPSLEVHELQIDEEIILDSSDFTWETISHGEYNGPYPPCGDLSYLIPHYGSVLDNNWNTPSAHLYDEDH